MKLKEKLYRFIYGRYGIDALYNFCNIVIIASLVISLFLSFILKNEVALAIANLCILLLEIFLVVWNMSRMFSKNIYKRRKENEVYLKIASAFKRFFTFNTSKKSKSGNIDNYQFIFRDCTKCNATLRLPRKEGRNSVKCPRCSHRFFVKSKKIK